MRQALETWDNPSPVDVFDELECRLRTVDDLEDDLLVISPRIDARLKDIAPRVEI